MLSLAVYQLIERKRVTLQQMLPLNRSDRPDLICELKKDFKAGLQFRECRRQPRMNRPPEALAPNLLDSGAPSGLQWIVLAGDPCEERTHRFRESALLGDLLALGENSSIHISQSDLNNHQPRANALTGRHFLAGRQ
jgi:hypothetical protein